MKILITGNLGYIGPWVTRHLRSTFPDASLVGLDMPGEVVDGQDVVAVFDAVQRAVARARSGAGPSLIECKTYRYYGHHQGDDPLRYRLKDEERAARERDCVQRFRQYVQAHALLTVSEIEDVDAGVKALLDDAVEFAEKSPVPEASELYSHVYVEP